MATPAERLQIVRDAIDALITGRVRSYTIAGRTVTYLDLKDLRAQEEMLAAEVSGGVAENLVEFEEVL